MSAFIVDHGHIDVLVALAVEGPRDRPAGSWSVYYPVDDESALYGWRMACPAQDPDAAGRMLLAENVRSVRYRYPDGPADELPGAASFAYAYQRPRRRLTAVEGLAAIGCYEYKACETPDWPHSEAYYFCEALKSRLITALPGYADAPSEWTREMAAQPLGAVSR